MSFCKPPFQLRQRGHRDDEAAENRQEELLLQLLRLFVSHFKRSHDTFDDACEPGERCDARAKFADLLRHRKGGEEIGEGSGISEERQDIRFALQCLDDIYRSFRSVFEERKPAEGGKEISGADGVRHQVQDDACLEMKGGGSA